MEKIVCDECGRTIREGNMKDPKLFTLRFERGKGIYPEIDHTKHFCTSGCVILHLEKAFPAKEQSP